MTAAVLAPLAPTDALGGRRWVGATAARRGLARSRGVTRLSRTDPSPATAVGDSDADLVRRSLAGDQDAFRLLVERYQQRAYWVARGMLGNDEDARDVAQEAFIRVHRSLGRFDTSLRFYTWLYQIVVNLCIDSLRKNAKRRGVSIDVVAEPGREESASAGLEGLELKQRVGLVLDALPPKYKAIMVLSDLQGVGAKEIAEITGVTHATVRWRHHRARKLFRQEWERLYGEGSHVV